MTDHHEGETQTQREMHNGAMITPYVTVRLVDEGGSVTVWRWRCLAPHCLDRGTATDFTYAEVSAWQMWESHVVRRHYHAGVDVTEAEIEQRGEEGDAG